LKFILTYPQNSSLFPIYPTYSTDRVFLEINLNYSDIIAEKQPVTMTVGGSMTKTMAEKTDKIFVEFRGAVPYNNETSDYGPWFSGVILEEDYTNSEGSVILTNETQDIIWSVQGYYNPVVIVREKGVDIRNASIQDYTDFPVYVGGYSDFQQSKSTQINTALSVAAVFLTIIFGLDVFRRFREKKKNDFSKTKSARVNCLNPLLFEED
jgi:hypothetical protein